jgi:putative dimethyl sulfoxide reductase chaperone
MSQLDLERASARELVLRLLAACYYEPGPEFAEERVFEAMREAAARFDPDLATAADRLGHAFAATPIDELRLDYARLFLGPDQVIAPPYGSVWLSGERAVMQDSTLAVLALYREGGFELADDFRDVPDHIAAELEFLYLLVFNENRARDDPAAETLASILALRRRFLAEHLGAWIDPFAGAVSEGARTHFYRELARLTQFALANEIAREF